MKSHFLPFLLPAFLLLTTCTPRTATDEILWDTWGVPHIYASTEEALYYAFGQAQMQSHGNLVLSLYGQARGRAAEYWGQAYLGTDRLIHTLGIPQMAGEGLAAMPAHLSALVRAFVNGINDRATAHPDELDEAMRTVLPVAPSDILAHAYRTLILEFLVRGELGQVRQWTPGSNAWAVGPSRSESGNALLLANPHLPWYGFWLFYEAQMVLNGRSLYGVTLVGMPVLGIAFNDHLGWTHTVNPLDNTDLYEVKSDLGSYLLDGEYHPMKTDTTLLKVRQDIGDYLTDTLLVASTRHGVILRQEGNRALALRFPGTDRPPDILGQWYAMGKATTLAAFEKALAMNQLPLFNTIYADAKGNILYHFGGLNPRKAVNRRDYWQGIVPGDSSAHIWDSYLGYDELPRLLNPSTGWLQNANDPPYTSTIPPALDPGDFPDYLTPNSMHLRAQQSALLLMSDENISLEEMVEYKHSTRVLLADRILDDLLPLREGVNDSLTLAAFDQLAAWDHNLDNSSPGPLLFLAWARQMGNMNSVFVKPWSFDQPTTTPDGIKDSDGAVQALARAAMSLQESFGTMAVPYGEVYRLRGGEHDLPANGGSGQLGLFCTLAFQPDLDGKYRAVHGDSYVAAVEFGKKPRAKVLLGYGNATRPGSKHSGDQLQLMSEKRLRDAWLTRKEVEENLEKKEKIFESTGIR